MFISAPGGVLNYHLIFAAKASVDERPGRLRRFSGAGTSYAAPLVSGVVALMLEANFSSGWKEVQGVLECDGVRQTT